MTPISEISDTIERELGKLAEGLGRLAKELFGGAEQPQPIPIPIPEQEQAHHSRNPRSNQSTCTFPEGW